MKMHEQQAKLQAEATEKDAKLSELSSSHAALEAEAEKKAQEQVFNLLCFY